MTFFRGKKTLIFLCDHFCCGVTERFNNGNPYTSYELGWLRVFKYHGRQR